MYIQCTVNLSTAVQSRDIEKIQHYITRYILGFSSEDYNQRMCNRKLPVSYRRVRELFLYKCIKGIYKLDTCICMYVKFNNVNQYTCSSVNKRKLFVPQCKTATGKKALF